MELMKAARLHAIRGMLGVDSIPVPQPGAGDVLVDIRAAGICHSDINYRDGVSPVARLPITLGHEIAGVVAKRGVSAAEIEEGDRVCIHYVISCGKCDFCVSGRENYCEKYQMIGKDVDGGFAEYVRVPVRNVLKLPDSIPFEQAAILGCAGLNCLSRPQKRSSKGRRYGSDKWSWGAWIAGCSTCRKNLQRQRSNSG